MLDIGCGAGRLSALVLLNGMDYVGIDLDSQRLREAQARPPPSNRASFVRGQATRLPFQRAEFTTVLLIRLTHRFGDVGPILSEIRRVLEPGGFLIASFIPNPSLGTLLQDLSRVLRRGQGSP